MTTNDTHDEDDDWVSKTKRKQKCDNMLELGEQMITLNKEDLDDIHMDDGLRHAIDEAQRMKSHGALKRQRHYIAKLIRNLDDETLEPQLDRVLHKRDSFSAEFKRMEKWRDNILENGDQGINAFLEQYPMADRHHLRQLVRNINKEKENNKPPATYRQIFKYIREVAEQAYDINENGT